SPPQFCPPHSVFAKEVSDECEVATDPNNLKKSPIEKWFKEEMFNDLFPKANLGLGPHDCLPYSYKSFIIAARYFPEFGGESSNKVYEPAHHQRRDVAAFFAHVLQETGENDISLYNTSLSDVEKADCFYRGGFYNWFERDSTKMFPLTDAQKKVDTAKELSWNYNYGLFQQFLLSRGIKVDLINNPNLVVTKMDPPLAMLASLWFYMTPQPPKPSMHSIVVGDWRQSEKNRRAGFSGPIFGPTSLVINNECGGEDTEEPGRT
ncbi:chitinase class I, partial [Ostertagia ostertagi]